MSLLVTRALDTYTERVRSAWRSRWKQDEKVRKKKNFSSLRKMRLKFTSEMIQLSSIKGRVSMYATSWRLHGEKQKKTWKKTFSLWWYWTWHVHVRVMRCKENQLDWRNQKKQHLHGDYNSIIKKLNSYELQWKFSFGWFVSFFFVSWSFLIFQSCLDGKWKVFNFNHRDTWVVFG